jgi:hypothetical protein
MRVQARSCNFQQMLVMCEEKHLSGFGKLGENAEAGSGALIIEVDKEIVSQHREYGTTSDGLLD